MKFVRQFWKSIKRNPVIVVAVVTIGAQVIQHAIDTNTWDAKTLSTYAFQLAMAYVAREMVVPAKEHKTAVADAYMRGLVIPHATPGENFDGGDEVDRNAK